MELTKYSGNTTCVEVTKYGGNAFDTKCDVIYFEITCTLAYQADIQACCFQNASLERYFQYIRP